MQRHMMNPTTAMFTFQRYLQTSADKAGLRIVFDEGIDQPFTKNKEVHIPKIRTNATQDDMVKLLHYVNHEAAHHKYGTDFKMMHDEAIDNEHMLGSLFNHIEDVRVDHHDSEEWLGDSVNLSDYYEMLSPNVIKAMDKLTKDEEVDPKAKAAVQTMVALDYLSREDIVGATLNTEKVLNKLHPDAKVFVDKAIDKGYVEEIKELKDGEKGSHEAWELAQRIYKDIFELDPEQAKEEMKQAQKDKGEDGDEEGEGEGDGEGEGEGAGKAKGKGEGDGEGEGEGGEYGESGESGWNLSPITVKYEQLAQNDAADEQYGGTGIHLDYSGHKGGSGFNAASFDQMAVVDYEKGTFKNIRENDDRERTNVSIEGMSGKGLANKVRRLLQIRSKAQMEYGKKRGKIHARNLHRVTMKGAPGYNQRVFKKRIENDTLDTAVSLLVDFSGSMYGSKMDHAIQSAILLYQAISKSLNIPLEIIGFSDNSQRSVMLVFKSFDGKISDEKLLARMKKGTAYMSSNADGEAIAWTYDRLQRRKEKKKLMVVLSDGSPACWRGGDIDKYTKEVIRDIEKGHKADIVGIGIEDSNVKRLYSNHQVINRTSELESAILNLVEKRIINE